MLDMNTADKIFFVHQDRDVVGRFCNLKTASTPLLAIIAVSAFAQAEHKADSGDADFWRGIACHLVRTLFSASC